MRKFKYLILLLALLVGLAFSANNAQAVPPAVEAKSEYLLADKLLNEGNPDQAIQHAEKAKSLLGKTNPRIEYLLTKAYFKSGKYDKAMASIESFFNITPEAESASEQYSEMVSLYSQIKHASEIEMVQVPGGCFQMGDTLDYGDSNEKPAHRVCVDSFQIGKYEVTQGQWQAVKGNNPSFFKKGPSYPVETVSWYDAQQFIDKLNSKTGKNYRLPTEAEWEYACRSAGRDDKLCGSEGRAKEVAWYEDDSTHPVGQKRPNGLDIYDMSGNIWEWCQDWYSDDYYMNSPINNPQGPSSGSRRVERGGSWLHAISYVRATSRAGHAPDTTRRTQGFRLVLPAGQ